MLLQLNNLIDIKIKFIQYLLLLNKWNQAYNLTAIRDPAIMITHHFLDSLAIIPYINIHDKYILDAGSGAGFPGIPLAIMLPQLHIELLDSNGKKTRFLHEVKRQLCLANIHIIQMRAEDYSPPYYFDIIVSRAFSNIYQFINWTQHLLKPSKFWLAMKGQYPHDELINIYHPYTTTQYKIADCDRCIIMIENK